MELPNKETIEQDAKLVAQFYMALTDKGVKPSEAATMSMFYLSVMKNGGLPKEPWQ